ncbi:MAG: S9 family peptidase [bacterium]
MNRFRSFFAVIVFFLPIVGFSQADSTVMPGPSFKDVLNLKSVGSPRISPDGRSIVYTERSVDWEKNGYDTEIWLARDGEELFQLTRTKDGSSTSPAWSPDGKWISFLSSRDKGTQIYLIRTAGGEAVKLTDQKEGVNSYRWSPDGRQIVFTSTDSLDKDMEDRKKLYGEFEVDDAEYRMSHLWLMDVDPDGEPEAKRLTSGMDFTVGNFDWSPDGKKIAFDHRPDPLIQSWGDTDISILDVETGAITPLVSQEGPDSDPEWSPDGRWILFDTAMKEKFYYYKNSELAKIPSDGGDFTLLTEAFDENPSAVRWTEKGIYFMASQKTFRYLYLLDPVNGSIKKIADTPENLNSVDFADDGRTATILAYDRTTLPEVYRASLDSYHPSKVTKMTDQVKDWPLGTREVVAWKSRDGAEIEGILWKPEGYDPTRRYPLFVIIHGGPTSTSRPLPVSSYVYPSLQWLAKGALILEPNYRGSAGYGEKFRMLNVRNLGVGDAWDVESGVDDLIRKGMAHPDSIGAMGWSQGGYISAFLTTNSTKFKAISVGAGISNWVTYYVNTDIHPFTRQYLKATPWDDMGVYLKTSPMTNIKKARTPTLIQHGEFDRRVPIPNAYELLQGLRDMDIESKLIVYKGFGHGISKPKEQLAATWHNWQWFAKYIWGEEVQVPLKE